MTTQPEINSFRNILSPTALRIPYEDLSKYVTGAVLRYATQEFNQGKVSKHDAPFLTLLIDATHKLGKFDPFVDVNREEEY